MEEKKIKVKIIKVSRETYWYRGHIGYIYDVVPHPSSSLWYIVVGDNLLIRKDDVEIISE